MENKTQINDCVEFKNELHKKLYVKSGAENFNEYAMYVNSRYSGNRAPSTEKNGTVVLSPINNKPNANDLSGMFYENRIPS